MQPYTPSTLPLKNLDYKKLFPLVGDANAQLARYDGLLQGVINPAVMLSPLTNEEAVLSSKIEGTQATIDEVLEQEAGLFKEGEKGKDIQEIINYREALLSGHQHLNEHPITLFFLRELHKILMKSVRGEDKTPGEFRKDQNWIGKQGCTIEQASFIPPDPLHLQEHLEDWQKYIEFDDIDTLLQVAVIHAQFELIHPFKDGNGRIGRILIPLFLYQKKKLSHPVFYLSAYLEAHREEYYYRLQNISEHKDWSGWIAFFFQAMINQAKSNNQKLKTIIALYEEMKKEIREITRSQYTIQLLDAIFHRPVFNANDFAILSKIPKKTVDALLKQLRRANILTTLRESRGRTSMILCFAKLLNIVEGRKIV